MSTARIMKHHFQARSDHGNKENTTAKQSLSHFQKKAERMLGYILVS